ncbi:MAG: cytochrome C [Burkholderiales bacterium]|nr:cytochrome C [Burkholderiales bacterium]
MRWLLLALLCSASVAFGQGIESIMAPGKVIEGHAKVEDDCKQCHVKFDRKAQDGLCTTCHKDVGADVRNKAGFHGRLNDPTCRNCHTDHKGRGARIVELDKKKFDHAKTDFALKGKHDKTECEKCHVAGKRYREAALECNACHKKDDVHKASLGVKCGDCHTESNWKEARFDHEATKFPLKGKHVDVKCTDCHKNNNYKETPRNCYACHRGIDDKKGHKGTYGEKCESCHNDKQWKPSTFNHDADTKYALRGKHQKVVCKDCHTGNLYRDKTSQECYACHKKDDKHKDSLGKNCAACHTEKSWKDIPRFDHDTSAFPLMGKHARAECKDCHKSQLFKEAPKDCYSCHSREDKHKQNLGKACGDCHNEQDWKSTGDRFKHERTRFPLRNAHALPLVKCSACHKNLESYRSTPLDCLSCHKKDDKHQGQVGGKCESCHTDKSWKETSFDHGLSRFPLTGRHVGAACKGCHETLRYKDAPSDCVSCHKKEDKHKQKLGARCESCHNARAWAIWSFDHDTKTKYKLEGAHRKATCESCHTVVAPKGKEVAPVGSTCISCHRSDDVHEGMFGARCEQCHRVENWKNFKNRIGLAPKPEVRGNGVGRAPLQEGGLWVS